MSHLQYNWYDIGTGTRSGEYAKEEKKPEYHVRLRSTIILLPW
jgi:hypothetical protein